VSVLNPPKVAILLATYNGASYLDAQLHSIANQIGVGIDLFVSDDGSTDGTQELLARWARSWHGRFEIFDGPCRGFSENFRSLALRAAHDSDFVAFGDQDDIWEPDKLSVAVAALDAGASDRPGLYFSRTRLISAAGEPIGFSPLFKEPPAFRNAIVQSIGGGNTMVLNRRGFGLFAESARRTSFATHDWWAYIICAGAGGFIYYDATAHIGYRQHADNLVGRNTGLLARLNRLRLVLRGNFAHWTDVNLAGLDRCSDMLTDDARTVVSALRDVRAARLLTAIRLLRRTGVYRQTGAGNLGLAFAAAIGKL